MENWDWLKTHEEGQFFERKSCYERPGGRARRRNVRQVAKDVAETLSAMADGGTLVLGVEDDGTPTGVDYPPDRLELTDGRYLLRVGDKNMPFPASDIEAIKAGKRKRVTESRPVLEASIHLYDKGDIFRIRMCERSWGFPDSRLIVC